MLACFSGTITMHFSCHPLQAQMLAFPPLLVPTQPPPGTPPTGGGGGVEPWIIIVSVVAAVLFIAVLAGLLWGVRHLT